MKRRIFFIAILCLCFNVFVLCSYAQESSFFVDRVIAVVNKEVITWSELYKFMEFILRDEVKNMNPDEKFKYFKKMEMEFLERLIDTKLQLQEAEKYGIFVTESEIDAAINDIKKKYGLSDKEFEENLKREGMTLSDYRKMMKEQIIIGRAVNSIVRGKILISDSEINNYISAHPEIACDEEGYYVSQIIIKNTEKQEEVKDKLNAIIKKLAEGESFSKVASQYSEDASAKTGGAIGLIKKREIPKELAELFNKMQVGQISEPLITAAGVYLFKLDGLCFKRGSDALKNYVRALIEEEKFKREYRLWVRGLRQNSYIDILD
ncbi:SurA N-terminal domain-containing protein [Thermodesulfovibrio hydrogeniphilus]